MPLKAHQHEGFVLLVANNHVNFRALKLQLDQHFRHVFFVSTKSESLALLNNSLFDLIFLARDMIDFKLISLLKTADCINNKTPVITCINAENKIEKEIIIAEFDDYLVTPIAAKKLNQLIKQWLLINKTTTIDYVFSILNKTKNNQQLTITIFKKLFEELPLQIICIKVALTNEQFALAQEITHKLHGSVSFCGLISIQKPANSLENGLVNMNYSAINLDFLVLQQRVFDFINQKRAILQFFSEDISQ